MEYLGEIVGCWVLLTIFPKRSFLDNWLTSECASDYPEDSFATNSCSYHIGSSKNLCSVISPLEIFLLGAIELCSKPVCT